MKLCQQYLSHSGGTALCAQTGFSTKKNSNIDSIRKSPRQFFTAHYTTANNSLRRSSSYISLHLDTQLAISSKMASQDERIEKEERIDDIDRELSLHTAELKTLSVEHATSNAEELISEKNQQWEKEWQAEQQVSTSGAERTSAIRWGTHHFTSGESKPGTNRPKHTQQWLADNISER